MKRQLARRRVGPLDAISLIALLVLFYLVSRLLDEWPLAEPPHEPRPRRPTSGAARDQFEAPARLSNNMIDKLSERRRVDAKISAPAESSRSKLLANLSYLLQPEAAPFRPAPGEAFKLLIVINSSWSNGKRRAWQRRLWLNQFQLSRALQGQASASVSSVEHVFVLGSPPFAGPDRPSLGNELLDEARRYGDVLVLNQYEHYRLMSYKHLAMFKWILDTRGSPSRLLVLKCDDDALVDLGQLLREFEVRQKDLNFQTGADNWIMCARFGANSPVRRNTKRSKWAVSRRDYAFDTYPSFCSGLAYLAPIKLLGRLLTVATYLADTQRQPPLWIDDVFVTGILASCMLEPPLVVRLNGHYCYTIELIRRRSRQNATCMVAEWPDAYLEEAPLHLEAVETGQRAGEE